MGRRLRRIFKEAGGRAGIEKSLMDGAVLRREGPLPGSLELAYLGDAVYDLYVRALVMKHGGKVRALHRMATDRVNARAQSEALLKIEHMLSEDERDVVRRARNANQVPPKGASPADYQRATGIEALMGHLALKGQTDRIDELMRAALYEDD